jgi:GDP-4-dehydro-6-deoxy-D-mannose reductase
MGISRALITGIGGFAGLHLAGCLVRQDVGIRGYTLKTGADSGYADCTDYGDIHDVARLSESIASHRADVVFHLAGHAAVGEAWGRRQEVYELNALGTAACMEAVAASGLQCRVVLVSSGLVYGHVEAANQPVPETHPRRPRGPYAASKLCAEIIANEYAATHGIELVIVRPFNFAGPRQGIGFVCADFAHQIASAEAGLAEPLLKVGNLRAERDFTDVRDFVEGLAAAGREGRAGATYNLCSGKPVAIQTVLDKLVAAASIPIEVAIDEARLRPADLPRFVGDNSRARADLGWVPTRTLDQTLRDTLNWWRDAVRAKVAVDG